MNKQILTIFIIICIILSSCYEDPMGVGVADRIDPNVVLVKPLDQAQYTDADSRIEFSIKADDFWGIENYYIVVNDQRVQDKDIIGGNGFRASILKVDSNTVWAVASDVSGNSGKSNVVNITYVKTIKIINSISRIDLFDIDSVYTLNLNTIFYDSFDNTSKFEFTRTVENYTGNWNAYLTDSILTINTFKYFSGSGIIVLTATKADGRSAKLEILLNIEPAENYTRIHIPDPNFRRVLNQNHNFTIDGNYIIGNEISTIDSLNLSSHYIIEDFEGLQHFKNLNYLNISFNKIKNVNFTDLIKIKRLECNSCNFIEDLDLSPLLQLEELVAIHNFQYLNFDVYHNINLKKLSFSSNMETIDLSNNTKLEYLYFEGMQRIDLQNNIALKEIKIWESQITQIDLNNNIELEDLYFTRTSLSELDIRNNTKLVSIKLNDNFQLTKVIVWELPLSNHIYVENEEHNIFVTNP